MAWSVHTPETYIRSAFLPHPLSQSTAVFLSHCSFLTSNTILIIAYKILSHQYRIAIFLCSIPNSLLIPTVATMIWMLQPTLRPTIQSILYIPLVQLMVPILLLVQCITVHRYKLHPKHNKWKLIILYPVHLVVEGHHFVWQIRVLL